MKVVFTKGRHIIEQSTRIKDVIARYMNELNQPYSHTVKPHIIPKICYTYWHEKMSLSMRQNYVSLIRENPTIKFHLYQEKTAREYLSKHFPKDVVHAFCHLLPHAYKCDLWKYCILYIQGGVYIDIKYACQDGFRLEELCTEEHFVLDRDIHWEYDTYGIYTGLMSVKPRSDILKQCIDRIVENVRQKDFGWDPHYPTGSGLLGSILFTDTPAMNIRLSRHNTSEQIFLYNKCVLKEYSAYPSERRTNYNDAWYSNLIYDYEYPIIQEGKWSPSLDHFNVSSSQNHCAETPLSSTKKVLCIYHIGNYDTFTKMKPYLYTIMQCNGNMYRLDLRVIIVDTVSQADRDKICQYLSLATIYTTANYGFDIASFFYVMNIVKEAGFKYDYVFKLHTKSCDVTRDGLLGPLFRDRQAIRSVMRELETDGVGMVASVHGKCDHLQRAADINIHYLVRLLKKYLDSDTYYPLPFVAGTMFCISFDLLETYFFRVNLRDVYNSFHNQYNFDYHWYYCNHYADTRSVRLNVNALYTHFQRYGKNKGYSRNLFHAIENTENVSKHLRDGMLEHGYERFFGYIVAKEHMEIRFLGEAQNSSGPLTCPELS